MLAAALFQKRSNNWFFYTEPQPGLDGRRIFLPRGKAIGGSFVFNGAQYIRGHRTDFDHWRQLGNEGWAYADVLPYFKRAESHQTGGDTYHGGDGPLHVARPDLAKSPLTQAFIAVVVLFPNGLAGVWELIRKKAGPLWTKFRANGNAPTGIAEPVKGE